MKLRHATLLLPFATLLVACINPSEPCSEGDCDVPIDECEHLETRSCDIDGMPGLSTCMPGEDGYVWGECTDSSAASTPLVLSFDGGPVEFSREAFASFDVSGDGLCHGTNWPSAATPWLALDRDESGAIENGAELFGSMTRLSTGLRAHNGFSALADLDSNHDGQISAEDEAFTQLVLWADTDSDRVSSSHEIRSLASAGIVSIALDYVVVPNCDTRGNCERERASFHYRDANGTSKQGAVIDVHLRHQ